MNYYAAVLKNKPVINEEDYAITNHEEIDKIARKLNKLQEQAQNLKEDLANKKEELIAKKYYMTPYKRYVHYSRTGITYDWDTCEPLPYNHEFEGKEGIDYITIETQNVTSECSFAMGFDLEKGVIITARYNIRIDSAKQKLHHTFQKQYAYSFLEGGYTNFKCPLKATVEFINKFFEVDYKGKLKQEQLMACFRRNKSFEIILKQAPEEMKDSLLTMKVDEAMPVHKIMNLTKPTYTYMEEHGLLLHLLRLIKTRVKLPENENELIEFLEACDDAASDFEFYQIEGFDYYRGRYYRGEDEEAKEGVSDRVDRTAGIAYTILSYYYNSSQLQAFYTLKKLTKYVIRETINQGYTSLGRFITELEDYIRMCETQNIKPTLESSYLKQTHDVCSRNHKIFLDEHQEEAFKNQYKSYKNEKIDDVYTIVVPANSNALKVEGDTLNHCVASYIKRVIDGECLIFFLRKEITEPLVTIELRNNRVAQIHGASNRGPSQEEMTAIRKWAAKHNYQ